MAVNPINFGIPILVLPVTPPPPVSAGAGRFTARVWMEYGPTIGVSDNFLYPNNGAVLAGTLTLAPGNSVALVAPTAAVTVQLPDVVAWSKNPQTALQNFILVRDVGGLAATNNITVVGAAGQLIDGLASVKITVNWGMMRITPNNEAPNSSPTGWDVT